MNHRSPRGRKPLRASSRHRHRAGGHLVLHVDGAAAPEIAVVVDDALERRVGPVARVAGDDVGVADERQRLGRAGVARAVDLRGSAPRCSPGRARGRPARPRRRCAAGSPGGTPRSSVSLPSPGSRALVVSRRIRSRATWITSSCRRDSSLMPSPPGGRGSTRRSPPRRPGGRSVPTGRRAHPRRSRSGRAAAATTPGRSARSAATHLAGSRTITRGSCTAPVTSRSGRVPGAGRLSYGE